MTRRPSIIQAAQRVTSAGVVREAQTGPLPGQSPRFRSASTDRHASVERGFNQNTSQRACPRQADGLPPPLAWLRRSRLPVATRSPPRPPSRSRQEPLIHTVSTGFPPRIPPHRALISEIAGQTSNEAALRAAGDATTRAGVFQRQAAVGRHAPWVDPAAGAAASRQGPPVAENRRDKESTSAAAIARGQVAGFPVRVPPRPAPSCGNARRRVFPCRLLRLPRRVFRHLARQPCSARAAPRAALSRARRGPLSRAMRRTTIHPPPYDVVRTIDGLDPPHQPLVVDR